MPGPLYHNGPLIWASLSLLAGAHVVLLPRFDAEMTLETVARHRATAIYLVPTMMQRIWKLPTEDRLAHDVSCLETAFHMAEPCPTWLKQEWIDWLGPDVIWELYAGTEGQSATILSGVEWLEHRGSVGRPAFGEMVIRDADGKDLPPGEVGDVWMRANRDTPTYRYIGDEPHERDGWGCLGDVGWMDEDGYLYLADRRKDMILVGGANVYPAEVEAALTAHPEVRSAAVIGLPDEERGNQVHAIVECDAIDIDELRSFLGERLVRHKIPRSFELVDGPLRDDAGKVRRSALRDQRLES
jgi:bile acid-coenzyme A ligase